ncbi:triacylglycerol lipase [Burkholderia sp. L27(2015)]|uniref:esterase/lipase family protein n=1 Tax=Burkholderia sp. L27(2015) TaxID=1641858 RepID=UPI00131E5E7B|nr:hypothetical protein [Burkholderia sp. L27(2015)]
MASNEHVVEPVIAEDGSVHYSTVMSPSCEKSVAVCFKVPTRIIPVIFVPGVMGSNLSDMALKPEPVWLADSKLRMAEWIKQGASKRKMILDPKKTMVFDGGAIPQGTVQSDAELKRRGWGEVANMSYGEFLAWLENALNDVHPGTDHGRNGLRAELMKKAVTDPLNIDVLTYNEVRLSYRYRFPVHAVGYNWLQDNAESAKRLHERIEYFMGYYRSRSGYMCEKVILVTHSMGGLVARHYSEILNYRGKVLGIVHGVMPATGAATAYKRVKAGTDGDWGTRHVLGIDAPEVTTVFAQSPGALQLLPTTEYGKGWLNIRDGDQFKSLPETEPYSEIYLQQKRWWGLVSDELLNPLDAKKSKVAQDWAAFAAIIREKVQPFHMGNIGADGKNDNTGIAGKYHANTYAFYGDDPQLKTWGNVAWRRARPLHPGFWNVPPIPIDDELNKGAADDSGMGSQIVEVPSNGGPSRGAGPLNVWPSRNEFVLQDADENGDGTVPRRSGAAPSRHAKVCVPYAGVDHEGAYKNEAQRRFALWAITKIAFSVRHTSMAYKDFK